MWIRQYSAVFKDVKAVDIWNIWVDIDNWPKWHDDLDYCKLNGKFEVGSYFMLKPKNMGPVKIYLTEIVPGRKFTDCTNFFGAKMYDTHELEETSEGLKLSNTLIVTGWLKYLWILLVAKNVADTIPNENENLVDLARKNAK